MEAHIQIKFDSRVSSMYQTEGAVFSPQQVGQQAGQSGLIPPAPAGCVEVGGDGQVDVWQKACEETHSQRHQAMQRQLLLRSHGTHVLKLLDVPKNGCQIFLIYCCCIK